MSALKKVCGRNVSGLHGPYVQSKIEKRNFDGVRPRRFSLSHVCSRMQIGVQHFGSDFLICEVLNRLYLDWQKNRLKCPGKFLTDHQPIYSLLLLYRSLVVYDNCKIAKTDSLQIVCSQQSLVCLQANHSDEQSGLQAACHRRRPAVGSDAAYAACRCSNAPSRAVRARDARMRAPSTP